MLTKKKGFVRDTSFTPLSQTEYRYCLEKGSKKHRCPDCERKSFVRYVDTQTRDYLPDEYGRCDREVKCGYSLNPYQDGYSKKVRESERGNNTWHWKPPPISRQVKPISKAVYFPPDELKKTLNGYGKNTFLSNLGYSVSFPFDKGDIEKVIGHYFLGTVSTGYREGAITFPFIDIAGNIRTIQVKQFDERNHTRGTDFLHSIIKRDCERSGNPIPQWLTEYEGNEKKVSCLFGEHLLGKYPDNPVALVEAPKSAIYGTLYSGLPETPKDLIWLAVYNLSSLNYDKCIVYPILRTTARSNEMVS